MILWIWAAVAVTATVLYLRRVYSRFSRSQVNSLPLVPLFGHMWRLIFKLEHFVDMNDRTYKAFPNDRFVGHYEFLNPFLMIRDIELIKQITVKDFDSFMDHRALINEDTDPIFGRNLFVLKGQKWKDMRSTLSPAFTSSKIRLMVPFMVEVGDQMVVSLKKKLKQQGSEFMDIDMKDLSTRYANDVIATCAFGLKVDSINDNNNEFYVMGMAITNFSFWQILKFLCFISMPTVMNILKIKLFSDNLKNFFKTIILDTMKNRDKNNIVRPDMINILMEAKKGNISHDHKATDEDAGFATVEESSVGKGNISRVWSDYDLVAQAVVFFVAGFDTVATVMTFLLFELALNPDCQDRLAEEIKNTSRNNKGFDYNSVQRMKYLDMLVSEVLRKWPPAVAADRIATKAYNIGKPNSKATEDYILNKGEGIGIPTWAIHHDPQYYENPEKFDPERFSDENKHKIQPFTYMPFGVGPRNCIGSRFALCEVKVMVYQLIQHMEVSISDKTCIPLQLSLETFNLRLKGGHWLRIRTRKN